MANRRKFPPEWEGITKPKGGAKKRLYGGVVDNTPPGGRFKEDKEKAKILTLKASLLILVTACATALVLSVIQMNAALATLVVSSATTVTIAAMRIMK